MSWTIKMVDDPCPTCGHGDVVFEEDVTYNLSPMLGSAGVEWALLNEMSPDQAKETILGAVKQLEADPERFRAMNPANGWGSYESLLGLLRTMLQTWKSWPLAKVKAY